MSHLQALQQATGVSYSDLVELVHSRPHIFDQLQSSVSSGTSPSTDEPSLARLLDLYPSMISAEGVKEKEVFLSRREDRKDSSSSLAETTGYFSTTVLCSGGGGGLTETVGGQAMDVEDDPIPPQQRYSVSLSAPISAVQRIEEDTLTYLNRGQFYSMTFTANPGVPLCERVKTVVYLCFFDQTDRQVEAGHWRYWYNLQANPDQRVFDVDYKNCENVCGKPLSISHNATAFVWSPKLGAKIVLRVNCLSTEFSSQKGVSGMPMQFVADSYEDLIDRNSTSPVHRAYCRVKMFRDKGAERKHKEETKTVKRKTSKFKQHPGGVLNSDGSESSLRLPNKETVFTSTSTLGQRPFLFIPQQEIGNGPLSTSPPFIVSLKEPSQIHTFSNILNQAKDNFDALEIESDDGDSCGPIKKSAKIPVQRMTIVYVRKDEEEVYHALFLDSLTVHDLKLQIACKYDIPADLIGGVYRRTKKKGLLVHIDDAMISQFEDEDDFVISLIDTHNGHVDIYIHY